MKRVTCLYAFITAMLISGSSLMGQSVPFGVNYQAVARNSSGEELRNSKIDVKFSIISDNQIGPVVYEEVHSNVITSDYGVFSLIIGKGTPVNDTKRFSTFSQIRWDTAPHYVKVGVKFNNNNDYLDMGTMQFLAVPYALYAQKSLEPGPQGPKGDKGDPASDNQKLSFDGTNLTISENGNTVNLSTLNVAHNLTILGDTLAIYGGNKVGLPNYMQDLTLDGNNILKVTKNTTATPISLSKYLQSLSYNQSTNKLSIANVPGEIDLTNLKNDADADPTNEIQTLSFDKSTGNVSILNGNSVSVYNMVGFKARKTVPLTGLSQLTTYPFVNGEVEFVESSCYNDGSGIFTAPITGIYSFYIYYKADGAGSGRVLSMLKNGSAYEILGPDITQYTELSKWVTIKLTQGETVSLTINTGTSTYSGTGTFVGYRVN